jgi:hypothetical protein
MMKKIITIALLLIASRAFSQDSLTVYNYMRNRISMNGSIFLGGWAAANITVGVVGLAATQGGTSQHYFYQMTTLWNVANLGAAIYGFTIANNNQNRLTADASGSAQRKIERTFLLNGALDVAYIGLGVLIDHKGTSSNSAIKKGYGSAIIAQGAFLFIFDVTMFSFEKHNGKGLMRFLGKHNITFDGKSVGMTMNI